MERFYLIFLLVVFANVSGVISFYDLDVIPQGKGETCLGETFQARCPEPDQVVVMETALYGRMKLGRCATMNLGYIGCSSDVISLADTKCSGRRSCDIGIPEMSFEETAPCFEVKTYLEASYSCLKVLPVQSGECQRWMNIPTEAPSGFIASVSALETWCGTSTTPWLIEAQPGQRINLTLYDFGVAKKYDDEEIFGEEDCDVKYAVITEQDPHRVITVCGGKQRRELIYVSFRNRVEIELIPRSRHHTHYFLIYYQVIGCPDPDVQPSMWFQRKDNEIIIGCDDSPHQWHLKCDGYVWQGQYGNCTGHDSIHDSQFQRRAGMSKHGLVAVVAGVMLTVILLLLLLPMMVYLYRRHGRKQRRPRALPAEPMSAQEVLPVERPVEEHCFMHHENQLRSHSCVVGGGGIVRLGGPKEVVEDSEEVYLKPAPHPRHIDQPPPPPAAPKSQQPLLADVHKEFKDPRFNTYQPEAPNKNNRGKSVQSRHEYKHIWERPLPIPGES